MTKKEMKNEFEKLFSVLMTGSIDEVRNTKKEIDKLWHKDSKLFHSSASVALEYLPKFDQIRMVENQAAFVSGLSLFFLSLGDEHFEILKDFILKVIQHPNGNVRQAIINTADWLYISLSSRTEPFIYPKDKKLTEKQKAIQKEAQFQYINFVSEIEGLMYKYDKGAEKAKYIEDIKPTVNKSLQIFWSRLTEGPMYRRILERVRPLSYEISGKRKEIEQELQLMLRKAGSDFDLDDIKEIIYNEDGQDCLTDILAMFDKGQGMTDLNNILEVVNDAWNYFPHETLDGLSPAEKIAQYKEMNNQDKSRLN